MEDNKIDEEKKDKKKRNENINGNGKRNESWKWKKGSKVMENELEKEGEEGISREDKSVKRIGGEEIMMKGKRNGDEKLIGIDNKEKKKEMWEKVGKEW